MKSIPKASEHVLPHGKWLVDGAVINDEGSVNFELCETCGKMTYHIYMDDEHDITQCNYCVFKGYV